MGRALPRDMDQLTFTCRQTSRDREAGDSDITYTDTVYSDGRVTRRVRGTDDHGYTNSRVDDPGHGPLNLDTVRSARLSSGWRIVPNPDI